MSSQLSLTYISESNIVYRDDVIFEGKICKYNVIAYFEASCLLMLLLIKSVLKIRGLVKSFCLFTLCLDETKLDKKSQELVKSVRNVI